MAEYIVSKSDVIRNWINSFLIEFKDNKKIKMGSLLMKHPYKKSQMTNKLDETEADR